MGGHAQLQALELCEEWPQYSRDACGARQGEALRGERGPPKGGGGKLVQASRSNPQCRSGDVEARLMLVPNWRAARSGE